MANIPETLGFLVNNFSATNALNLIKPLLLFIGGLGIYSIFIFNFYRFLARRDMFKLKLFNNEESYTGIRAFIHGTFHLIKYIFISPLFLLFWVLILSSILIFLSKNSSIETILLISVSLVGVIRFVAYYNEDLSKDLAKMMPFALLGVFLVDISYFSLAESSSKVYLLLTNWVVLAYYLVILILIEFILRILYFLFAGISFKKIKKNLSSKEKASN